MRTTTIQCDRCKTVIEHPYPLTYEQFQHGQRLKKTPLWWMPRNVSADLCDGCMSALGTWLGTPWPTEKVS